MAEPRQYGGDMNNNLTQRGIEEFHNNMKPTVVKIVAKLKEAGETSTEVMDQFVEFGVIVRGDGHVITSGFDFPAEDYTTTVTTSDGNNVTWSEIGRDQKNGLVLLKLEGAPFPYATIANEPPPEGHPVHYIDLGLHPYRQGMVTCRMRRLSEIRGTDAFYFSPPDITSRTSKFVEIGGINAATRGAPIFDNKGRIVGVSAFFSETRDFAHHPKDVANMLALID